MEETMSSNENEKKIEKCEKCGGDTIESSERQVINSELAEAYFQVLTCKKCGDKTYNQRLY